MRRGRLVLVAVLALAGVQNVLFLVHWLVGPSSEETGTFYCPSAVPRSGERRSLDAKIRNASGTAHKFAAASYAFDGQTWTAPRTRLASSSGTATPSGGPEPKQRPVWLFPKSWWISGLNARNNPFQLDAAPHESSAVIFRWDEEVSAEAGRFYAAIQRPYPMEAEGPMSLKAECDTMISDSAFEELRCAPWGITSGMRDVGSLIIWALLNNRSALQRADVNHLCKQYCNRHRGTLDTHLGCFFLPFSACRSPYENTTDPRSRVDPKDEKTMWMCLSDMRFAAPPQWDDWLLARQAQWWSFEQQTSSIAAIPPVTLEPPLGDGSPTYNHAVQMSFFRSLLSAMTWRPNADLARAITSLEEHYHIASNNLHPMVVVHVRRTDKRMDLGLTAALRAKFGDGQLPVHVYGDMVRLVETTVLGPGQQFKTVFLLSDDLAVWHNRHQVFGARNVLTNPMWIDKSTAALLDNPEWLSRGHESLGKVVGDGPGDDSLIYEFHKHLMADILFAGKHGDYLVGCGSSGVSQLIAQAMGWRLRMDGNWLSLWEEDYFLMDASR